MDHNQTASSARSVTRLRASHKGQTHKDEHILLLQQLCATRIMMMTLAGCTHSNCIHPHHLAAVSSHTARRVHSSFYSDCCTQQRGSSDWSQPAPELAFSPCCCHHTRIGSPYCQPGCPACHSSAPPGTWAQGCSGRAAHPRHHHLHHPAQLAGLLLQHP